VTSVDVEARTATVIDIAGEEHRLGYHSLVLAPGSVPSVPPFPGWPRTPSGSNRWPVPFLRRRRARPDRRDLPPRTLGKPSPLR
jgi:NADPH-dependent 2,4-dienoyl-CoA reductase/sulfur reductase-like enzyme